MDLRDRTVLILGGWGLVGMAIARALVRERPERLVIHSLRESEAREGVETLRDHHGDAGVAFEAAWGNVFVREGLKDRDRSALLADRDARRAIVDDTMDELGEEILHASCLWRIFREFRPDAVIDCVNTATAFAYQDVFYSVRRVRKAVAAVDAGETDAAALRDEIESHLTTLSLPQLIRHVQILRESLREAGTSAYLKVGTTGTGGMGLNIPYTHSEERPSRVLLSKSSIAGAHTMLLFLLARTPGAPLVKEIKPAAAIGWKRIGAGPIERAGRRIRLYDCPPDRAVSVERALAERSEEWNEVENDDGEPGVLESVFIDTGENGVFSCEEFETVTALGQMEYVTPEEIADHVLLELKGGTGGREMVAALDGAVMGPTYRAGVMRYRALEQMRRLERETGHDSIAFEMLGPPRLSKLLYEAYLLRRTVGSLSSLARAEPASCSEACASLVARDGALRARILSIGIPIWWPDGTLSRGPEMKIPPYKEEARPAIGPEAVERWADAGWVDLRGGNFARWAERARRILASLDEHPGGTTSSIRYEDRAYWKPDEDLPVGRVAAWIFGVEDSGSRGKPS